MQSLSWYVARLQRMSPAEVAYRAGKLIRRHLPTGRAPAPTAPVAALPDSARLLATPVTAADVDSAAIRTAAGDLTRGRLQLFDLKSYEAGEEPDWNRDPLTGTRAPNKPAWRIDYRDPDVVGNIKYLWEPSRHLHFVTLAQAIRLQDDEAAAEALNVHLRTWLDQCPPGVGPHWTSALELAIRLINWTIVRELLHEHPLRARVLPPHHDLERRWIDSAYHHIRHIAGNYSRYSSANNHLIGEAAGVYIALAQWPFWPQADRWRRDAQTILEEEIVNQTWPDGGNKEQAVSYQQFALDFFLFAGLIARRSGQDFPQSYWRTIESMLDFTAGLMDVAGNMPMIGDADDGYVTRLCPSPDFCPYRSLLATGALLFARPDFARKAGDLDDKTVWLMGATAREELAELARRADANTTSAKSWPHTGYYLLGRDFDTPHEIRMLVDAAPLGYLSIAAHGHADALSLTLNVAGLEILIDPGTYCYHTEAEWRRYFRGTTAHNTLTVDNQDQSVQQGNFMWSDHANCTVHQFVPDNNPQRLLASHDGYRRLSDPLTHKRDVLFDAGLDAFEVTDTLECNQSHTVVQAWHFAECVDVQIDGAAIIAHRGPVTVRIVPERTVGSVQRLHGSDNPPGGWVSRSFGVRRPATTVLWRDDIEGTARWRTRILCNMVGGATDSAPATRAGTNHGSSNNAT